MALPWLIFLLWPPFAAPLLTHSCPSSPPSSANTMLPAYQRAAQFNSEAMGRLVTNASIQPHWLPDGDHFWYASHSPKGTTFILVDASTGRLEPAFDASKVAHLLARITDKPVLPLQLPFSNFLYTPQRDAIAFELAGKWLRISLKDYSYRYIATPKLSLPAVAPTQKPSPSAYPQFYLANNNIVMRISANDEKPLTTDGNAQNTYSAFSLSPNRRYLAAWRTVPGEHGEMYNVVSVPSNGSLRPTLRATPTIFQATASISIILSSSIFKTERNRRRRPTQLIGVARRKFVGSPMVNTLPTYKPTVGIIAYASTKEMQLQGQYAP